METNIIIYPEELESDLKQAYKEITLQNKYKNKPKYDKLDYIKLDLLSRKLSLPLNNVELKPSKIHGKGVFTIKKILKGQIITMYPADIVSFLTEGRLDGDENKLQNKITMYSYEMIDLKNKNPDISISLKDYDDYKYSIDFTNYDIYGNPEFDRNPAYLGHFINDSARCHKNPKSIPIYYNVTSAKRNCEFENICGLQIAIIAIRDIEIGEELFLSYGIGYWNSIIKENK